MPPSGFNYEQAALPPGLLRSCWASLRSEGERDDLTPDAALRREIGNIDSFMVDEQRTLVGAVLLLIRDFYREVLASGPHSYVKAEATALALADRLQADMLAIHVPDAPVLPGDSTCSPVTNPMPGQTRGLG